MRRSLTTLAAIAALTALPATAHASHTLPDEMKFSPRSNSPDTVLNPQRAASDSLDDGSQVGATITNVLHKANPNVQSMAFVAGPGQDGGTEVKVEGQESLILSARDILAVIG
jgi:co-chaperonin GroES (HSP10)